MITSVQNEKIKQVQKLHQKKYRDESKLFLIEGKTAVLEVLSTSLELVELFVTEKCNIESDLPTTFVSEHVMAKLSTTDTPPQIIAVAKQLNWDIEAISNCKKIALFENIKDAGNLGTIIRSAKAFNIEAIILLGDCVELYNPKIVRSSVGLIGKIPICKSKNIDEVKAAFPNHKFIATTLGKDSTPFAKNLFADSFLLLFGSEADGLTPKTILECDIKIRLEMNGEVESLNLAIASSILFYELNKS